MRYEIYSYSSVGPLTWGMTASEVAAAIGAPSRTSRNRYKNVVEFRDDFSQTCIYDAVTIRLVEVTFSSQKDTLFFGATDLIGSSSLEVVRTLFLRDSGAITGFDSIVYPQLGIALTGHLPNNEAIKSASAFARERWDIASLGMSPLVVPQS